MITFSISACRDFVFLGGGAATGALSILPLIKVSLSVLEKNATLTTRLMTSSYRVRASTEPLHSQNSSFHFLFHYPYITPIYPPLKVPLILGNQAQKFGAVTSGAHHEYCFFLHVDHVVCCRLCSILPLLRHAKVEECWRGGLVSCFVRARVFNNPQPEPQPHQSSILNHVKAA